METDEQELSQRKFLLELRGGFSVITAASYSEAVQIVRLAKPRAIDLLLTRHRDTARRVKQIDPELPILLTRTAQRMFSGNADVVLVDPSPAELLECCRILCTRKRGPKKRAVTVTVAEAPSAVGVA